MPEFPIPSARILLVSQIQGGGRLPSLPPCPVRLWLTTEPSLLPVLGCGTVYHQTLSHVTQYHGFVVNTEHSCSDSHTHLLCFLFVVACGLSWSLRFLTTLKIHNVM